MPGALRVPNRSVGRPSVADVRRAEILDAFLELIAERGLEAVTLDDVAGRAGVQRSVVRHYVGNRASLVAEAASRLVDRYEMIVRRAIGEAPTVADLVDHLFAPAWSDDVAVEDAAFDELYREATRDPHTRERLRRAYELLVAEIAAAIARERPRRPRAAVRQAAYQIVCLAEHNTVLQQLGLPRSQASAARRTALSLALESEER
jgi:AcrR family transcriptional regulator